MTTRVDVSLNPNSINQAFSETLLYSPSTFMHFFTKSYDVGTHLNCLDKSRQYN